jgi:hypothetical protein
LRGNALEVSDKQHPKVNTRSNPRPPVLRVVLLDQVFHKPVESSLSQQPVETLIKHMPRPDGND